DALAFQGKDVTVIIDDGAGQQLASSTIDRIERARRANPTLGHVRLVDTAWILAAAVRVKAIPDRTTMKKVYQQLRGLDDGLMPIERTVLLSQSVWTDTAASGK
ncbi:MAG: hypothetical protein ABIW49_09745, partial [Knoellia sp.]